MTSKAFGLAQLGNAYSDGALGSRNRIINGAMTIDQRNAGAAVTVTDAYTLDRWFGRENTDGALSFQRVADAPAGFVNSAKVTVTTADASVGADQFAYFAQRIEGFNISDLAFGTASASTVTVSFWVKSSLTGTFGGALRNGSAGNRAYPFTYAISSANTWEKKTVIIAGDTTGTWATDNSQAMALFFGLGVGSNRLATAGAWAAGDYQSATGAIDLISTLNATWQITGVQLEAGDTATPFEHRSYGQELALCQRYYYRTATDGSTTNLIAVNNEGSTICAGSVPHPVRMRAAPTISLGSDIRYFSVLTSIITPTLGSNRSTSTTFAATFGISGAASDSAATIFSVGANGYLEASAEL